jgi:exonuclease III
MVWGLLKSKWFFLSTTILLIGIPFHIKVFSIDLSTNEIPKNANTFKVMSYNVRLFGYFDDSRIGANKTKNQILNLIRQEQPDVLCIQEYFHQDGEGKFNTKDSIYEIMGIRSHHEKSIHHSQKNKHFGIALFCKYPIINQGVVHRGGTKQNSNFCIYADIVKKRDTIRVYNVHFQSIKLKADEYSKQTAMNTDSKTKRSKFRSGLSKLNNAFKIRSKQSNAVRSHLNDSPYESILW